MEHLYNILLCKWKEISKRAAFSLIIPAISVIYPILNRPSVRAVVMHTFIDDIIPFNASFVVPYMLWYAYVTWFLLYLCIIDKESYFKLLNSLIIGMLISYVVFYFYPSHVPRPIIVKKDVFSELVAFIYQRDNPYNCFPSIHVLNSLLVAMYVNASYKVMMGTKITCSVLATLIIISTLFIKQHYFVDAIGAIFLGCTLFKLMNIITTKQIKDTRNL